MVVHWLRTKDSKVYYKLIVNMLGALITTIALVIIIVTKFLDGAWIIIFVAPALALLMYRIKRHYVKIECQIKTPISIN